MSKVHDAMRTLERQEHKEAPENGPEKGVSNLIGALIAELVDEVPDSPQLETVRGDLIAASRSFERAKKKDLALRFYLAFRSLLRENELLEERLKKAERRANVREVESFEDITANHLHENGPSIVEAPLTAAGAGSD